MSNNNIRNNSFLLTIKRIPGVEYKIQQANLPSFSIGAIPMPSPVLDYSIPGDKIAFGSFVIEFIVDEDLSNYIELWNWVNDIASYDRSAVDVKSSVNDMVSDATLSIISNNKNVLRNIDYIDCFPQTVGDLNFDLTGEATELTCSVTFEYSYFKFVV